MTLELKRHSDEFKKTHKLPKIASKFVMKKKSVSISANLRNIPPNKMDNIE